MALGEQQITAIRYQLFDHGHARATCAAVAKQATDAETALGQRIEAAQVTNLAARTAHPGHLGGTMGLFERPSWARQPNAIGRACLQPTIEKYDGNGSISKTSAACTGHYATWINSIL